MSVMQRLDSLSVLPYSTPSAASDDARVPLGWAALAQAHKARAVIERIEQDGYPAAAAELTRQIDGQRPCAELYAMRAMCLLHMGAPAQAAEDAQQACTLRPNNASLFALHAIALADVHRPDAMRQARASLTRAQTLSPTAAYLSVAEAKLALVGGNYRVALHAVDAAVQQAPRCALSRSVQADISLQLAGPNQALHLTQSTEPLTLKSPHMQAVGIMAQSQLRPADAKALAACAQRVQALQKDGAFVPYVVLAAALVAHQQGHSDKAQRLWDQAPHDVWALWAPGQLQRAAILVGLKPHCAADVLRHMPAAHAKHPGVRTLRAQLMEASGSIQVAKQGWARLARDTDDEVRAAALWAQAGRPSGTKGLSDADRATLDALLAHAPRHPEALYQMANDALVGGNPQRAIDLAQRLLATGDETGRAHFILGMTRFGPAPGTHFRQYLQAPKRDALLLDEARLYIAHQAFASGQWDDAIDQVRALPPDALHPEAKQTLAYIESLCQQGLVLRGAEESIASVRSTLSESDAASDALQAAFKTVDRVLGELDTVDLFAQTPARLVLLGQRAWLCVRLHQSKAARACLAEAKVLQESNPASLNWPEEAKRAEAAMRAARLEPIQQAVGFVLELLKAFCKTCGIHALTAAIDYLEHLLREYIFTRDDAGIDGSAF